jgi:hypothetical protein
MKKPKSTMTDADKSDAWRKDLRSQVKVLRRGEVWSEDDLRVYTEELEMPLTKAEWKRLESEAAALGVLVDDLVEQRLNPDEPDPDSAAQVITMKRKVAGICDDLKLLRETGLPKLRRDGAPRETLDAFISVIMEEVKLLRHNLAAIRREAPNMPEEIREPVETLEAELDQTMTAILETGCISGSAAT